MRKINDSVIVEFLKEYQDGFKQPPLGFYPVVDNVTVFGDYIGRAKAGNFTKVVSFSPEFCGSDEMCICVFANTWCLSTASYSRHAQQ